MEFKSKYRNSKIMMGNSSRTNNTMMKMVILTIMMINNTSKMITKTMTHLIITRVNMKANTMTNGLTMISRINTITSRTTIITTRITNNTTSSNMIKISNINNDC